MTHLQVIHRFERKRARLGNALREVNEMMYPYLTFADGTEVVHSDIVLENDAPKIYVHFERPTEDGFDSARCSLPSYEWESWEGSFSDDERAFFERFLKDNAALLFRYAGQGGLKVA